MYKIDNLKKYISKCDVFQQIITTYIHIQLFCSFQVLIANVIITCFKQAMFNKMLSAHRAVSMNVKHRGGARALKLCQRPWKHKHLGC